MYIVPMLVVCMLATACLLYVDCRYVQQIEEEDITGTIIALMFALSVLFPVGMSLALYNIILSLVTGWNSNEVGK